MKKISLLATIAFITCGSLNAADLTITILGLKEAKGTVKVSLFANENDWLQKARSQKEVDAQTESITITIADIEPGEYAVSAIHDSDSNGKLNSGAFGKPTEAYGFSNDARKMFGPASWNKAKFEISNEHKSISFTVK